MQEAKCATMLILMLLAMTGCAAPEAVPTAPPFSPTRVMATTVPLSFATSTVSPTVTAPLAPVTSGGLVEKLGLAELTLGADCILVGTVEGIWSEWNRDRTNIYTYVEFSVESSIKGCLNETEVTIRFLGGQVGDVSQDVSTAPTFEAGERAVVFLKAENDAGLHVVGGFQGKFTVQDNTVLELGVSLPDFVKDIQSILQGSSLAPTPANWEAEASQVSGSESLYVDVAGHSDN